MEADRSVIGWLTWAADSMTTLSVVASSSSARPEKAGAGGPEDLGADLVCGTVRCIEHDTKPVEIQTFEESHDVGDVRIVVCGGIDDPTDLATARIGGERREFGLDATFESFNRSLPFDRRLLAEDDPTVRRLVERIASEHEPSAIPPAASR